MHGETMKLVGALLICLRICFGVNTLYKEGTNRKIIPAILPVFFTV